MSHEFNGELSVVATRRLLREQADLNRDGLEMQGIFHHFDDVHPHKAVAIIIGPDGSPYARAPYLFRFVFPNTYPLKPPCATFCTGDGRVRFNPNLYTNGKVCLSILGTWAGPSWTSLSTFRSVLLSIQSLLSLNPLQNEPGHEHETGRDCDLYSAMLRYESLAVAALQLTKPLDSCFEPVRELLGAIFLCNFHAYTHSLGEFAACEGCLDRCPVYGFISKYSASCVRQQLEELQAELLLRPEAVAVAEELRKQALPSCTEEVAFGRSSDGTGQSAGSHEGVPEGTRIHVARGVWRMAGPSVYQFLRRICLVMVLILAALGFGIAVAFLLGAVTSRAHGQGASQQNFRDKIGPGLPRNHELYRQLNQKHAGALNDAFFHYQKRLFEAEGDFDRAMSPDFETSTPPPDANSSWPDMNALPEHNKLRKVVERLSRRIELPSQRRDLSRRVQATMKTLMALMTHLPDLLWTPTCRHKHAGGVPRDTSTSLTRYPQALDPTWLGWKRSIRRTPPCTIGLQDKKLHGGRNASDKYLRH
eukprot:s1250_g10.t3